jgi:hypothetical protein
MAAGDDVVVDRAAGGRTGSPCFEAVDEPSTAFAGAASEVDGDTTSR